MKNYFINTVLGGLAVIFGFVAMVMVISWLLICYRNEQVTKPVSLPPQYCYEPTPTAKVTPPWCAE